MARLNNNKRYPGVRGRRPDLKKFRQEEALVRQAEYDKLSVAEKLKRLDTLFGEGLGATRQRAKLAKRKS